MRKVCYHLFAAKIPPNTINSSIPPKHYIHTTASTRGKGVGMLLPLPAPEMHVRVLFVH